MTEKFKTGSLACYRVRKGFVPRTPAQIQAIAAQHGMPATLCPDYAGDQAMVSKAIQAHAGKAKAAGWLVTPLESTKGKVVYTIARIEKDTAHERTDFTHETTIKWSSEGGNGAHIEGWHDVAHDMDETYQSLRGMVLAGDWTRKVIDYMTGPCKGVAFLDAGHVYWVPPQGTAQLQALRGMLDDVGIGLAIGEIDAEAHADVQEVAQGGLNEQLEALRAKVEGLQGEQSAKVDRNILAQLREYRATQQAYEAALGVKFDEVRALGVLIETTVREHLTVQLGTEHRPPIAVQVQQFQALVAQGETALAQALIDGRLVLDGDTQDIEMLLAEAGAGEPDAATLEALAHVEGLDPVLARELAAARVPTNGIPDTF